MNKDILARAFAALLAFTAIVLGVQGMLLSGVVLAIIAGLMLYEFSDMGDKDE